LILIPLKECIQTLAKVQNEEISDEFSTGSELCILLENILQLGISGCYLIFHHLLGQFLSFSVSFSVSQFHHNGFPGDFTEIFLDFV